MLLPIITFTIFVFVWYFPVWYNQRKTNMLPKRTILKSVLVGMIPCAISILLIQIGLGFVVRSIKLQGLWLDAEEAYITAALVEECVKFFGAYLIIKKLKPSRKVDYVLIFGGVGLGYEIFETLLQLDSVLAGMIRGVFALHVIWQLWMGMFYWEYVQAKKSGNTAAKTKNFLLAFGVPIFLHGTNDFLLFVAEKFIGNPDAVQSMGNEDGWITAFIVFMALQIAFQIYTTKLAVKISKDSNETDME